MKTKICFSILVVLAGLAALPLYAQNFPPRGDDHTRSFGQFWILIDAPFQPLFAGCPAFNATTHVLASPLLYDNITTVIGRSASIKEGSPQDNGGVPVGSAGTMIRDAGMVAPPSFTPIAPGSNEVHTELRHLKLETYPAPPPPTPRARVRAGMCYNSAACSSPPPPNRISRGEVVSNNATPGASPDFPARSYFNVFAQIDIPPCGSFPGATVFNQDPLKVATPSISSFPPSGVVYMHDSSSAVGVRFLGAGKGFRKNQRLGCVIVAGHGIVPTFPRRGATITPPQKEEAEKGAARFQEHFQEHMKGEFDHEGGRHKDCGPRGKDD